MVKRYSFLMFRIFNLIHHHNIISVSRLTFKFIYSLYRYHDSDTVLTVPDIVNSFEVAKDSGADGSVIWGSSHDFSSKKRCEELKVLNVFYQMK